MTMKAVAYHRTRPAEPEASVLALRLQREAVQRAVEADGLTLVAEFIEREGENDSETWPAYVAAVRAAVAHKADETMIDVALIIASHAGIGTGEPFREPEVKEWHNLLTYLLNTALAPAPPGIVTPQGAPASLCLYAECRPRQLDMPVYLCNAGPDALAEVTVAIDTVDVSTRMSAPAERRAEDRRTREERWGDLPPCAGVLVDTLDHWCCDEVSRYRVTYTDPAGRRWTAEANDPSLIASDAAENPDQVWVAFGPARAAGQAVAGVVP